MLKIKTISKYLLFIVLMCFTSITKVGAVPANPAFTDDNFYRSVVDEYNETNHTSLGYDVSLTNEQLKTITYLYLNGTNTTSIKGLEKLTNLKSLFVYGEQITTLDLSQNVNLENLDIQSTPIGTLDLSHNTKLVSFRLYEGELTTLDFGQNTNLESINIIYADELTNINIANNTKLKNLNIESTSLSTLDVSHNTGLKNLSFVLKDIDYEFVFT